MEKVENRSNSTDFSNYNDGNNMKVPKVPEQIQNQSDSVNQNSNSKENIEIAKKNINEGYGKKKKKEKANLVMNLVIIY